MPEREKLQSKSEELKQPEIKIDELMSVIESVEWESGYQFSYHNSSFHLIIISEEETKIEGIMEGPAQFHPSTLISGWDIYLYDTIPQEERKRILFHEILEINLREQGFSDEAHKIALQEEEKVFGKRK